MTKIGFIGLGKMGSGIASRIQLAGYDLTVWNRTSDKTDVLVAQGAKRAASVRDAVRDADIVITSLMDDQSVLDVVAGENGILSAMKPGSVHLCLTTISPSCANELHVMHCKKETRYVSGPVVGRPDAAALGQLTTYLSGLTDATDDVRNVCESYSKLVVRISDKPGAANALKLCINYVAIGIIEVMGEAYALSEKNEIDTRYLHDFLQTAFSHPALKMYATKIREGNFKSDVGFAMAAGAKDVRLMLETGAGGGVALEVGQVVLRKMLVASVSDLKDADWSAICEVTRREAELRSREDRDWQ